MGTLDGELVAAEVLGLTLLEGLDAADDEAKLLDARLELASDDTDETEETLLRMLEELGDTVGLALLLEGATVTVTVLTLRAARSLGTAPTLVESTARVTVARESGMNIL